MLEAYLIVLIGVCAAQAAPGPNLMAVAGAGLGQSRRAALFVVSGVASGVLIWAGAVAYGLGELFRALPVALTVLKFVGGLYLLFLGAKALMAVVRGNSTTIKASPVTLTDFGAWRRGFIVVMTNPKAALMWSAVATFLFGVGLSRVQVLAFGPIAALSALAIYGAYGFLFSTNAVANIYSRFTRAIEAVLGVTFGALGMVLVDAGIRDLRP